MRNEREQHLYRVTKESFSDELTCEMRHKGSWEVGHLNLCWTDV
jgi:hypothetical protein